MPERAPGNASVSAAGSQDLRFAGSPTLRKLQPDAEAHVLQMSPKSAVIS
jgi:hypothetical protein